MDKQNTPTPAAGGLQAAVALYRAGRFAETERACGEILAAAPENIPAKVLYAQAMAQRGDPWGAIKLLREALRLRPDSAPALNSLVVLLLRNGQVEDARAACDQCLAVDASNVAAFYNLGQIADMAGKPDEAAAAYGRAVELNPQLTAALVPLALALQKLGREEDAVAFYERVPAGDKSEFIAQFNRGLLQQGRGNLTEAASAFTRAGEIDPADAKPRFQLGGVFYAMGRFDEAIECYRQLLLRKTDTAGVHGNLAKALWAKGDAAGALAACDDGLRQRPGDTAVIAFKAAMLLENGDTAAARMLVDFDRLMKPIRIPPPAGFTDIPEFNKAISQYALTHPTLVFEPRNHATKSGRHTGELMLKPGGPVPAFASAVAAEVRRYLQEVPIDPAHPFAAQRPARWRLSAWAVVMEGQGYQAPHIHPQAWLSGVYYASVPPDMAAADTEQAGWIEFGEPLPDYRFTAKPELRLIKPEEGLMLLFPSYFFHRTLPFSAGGTRISIAFDVVPTA